MKRQPSSKQPPPVYIYSQDGRATIEEAAARGRHKRARQPRPLRPQAATAKKETHT